MVNSLFVVAYHNLIPLIIVVRGAILHGFAFSAQFVRIASCDNHSNSSSCVKTANRTIAAGLVRLRLRSEFALLNVSHSFQGNRVQVPTFLVEEIEHAVLNHLARIFV